jgi:hypothetical protein
MSWRMFGQILLLVAAYCVLNYGFLRLRDNQIDAAFEAKNKAMEGRIETSALDDSLPLPPEASSAPDQTDGGRDYDAPPKETDPKAEMLNGVWFRRDGHYRPGSPEAEAQKVRNSFPAEASSE